MSYSLAVPKVVRQTGAWTCWAAAAECWTWVTPGKPYLKEAEILESLSDLTDKNGGLTNLRTNFPKLARVLGMGYEVITGADLTYDYVETSLCWTGYLYLAYNRQIGAHAVVIYGIDSKNISLMDPEFGLRKRPLSAFSKVNAMVVGYPI